VSINTILLKSGNANRWKSSEIFPKSEISDG
jgi:hypothetical protein